MWECAVCGMKNSKATVACRCGFDESKNYGRYLVLSPLDESDVRAYEELLQVNQTTKDWKIWFDSVKDEVRMLDEEDAGYLLEQMKDYYTAVLAEIKDKKNMVTTFVLGPETEHAKCPDEMKERWKAFKGRMDSGQKWNYEGICWYFGAGRPQNYSKAVECYKKAMEERNLDAVNNLANCYFYGTGTAKNCNKAIELYKIASNVGHAEAVYNMGYCYQYGIGLEKDDDAAFGCYMMAAEAGVREAQRCVGNFYFSRENMYRAVEWYERAANAEDIEAMRCLGYCYRYGEGVKADREKALYWYQQAAKKGDLISQNIVDNLYQTGEDVIKDKGHGGYWYQQAPML